MRKDIATFAVLFQSTLPARGATALAAALMKKAMISIHAPREGSDRCLRIHTKKHQAISIYAPREGSDGEHTKKTTDGIKFQSTLPARGATLPRAYQLIDEIFQSTLPARGATRIENGCVKYRDLFQSTLPARGATKAAYNNVAPRVNFNPRSPRGERRKAVLYLPQLIAFQSTLPARGATSQNILKL